MKLHCFGESGNSYKAALTLELAGCDWKPVKVDFFAGTTRTQEFRGFNEMGEAPILVDGELKLSQSGAIQQYVIDKTGKLGGEEEETYEVLRWVLWDNHKLSSQAGITRFLINFLPADKPASPDVIAFMQGRLHAAYTVLNDHLEGREWVVGSRPTVADLSCCGYLFYEEPFGFSRADWPHIDAWLARISALPGWKHPYDLMPGSPADRA